MNFLKEIWFDVIYKDTSEKKPVPRIRSFKLRKMAEKFFNDLDSQRFDKHLVMYEKTLLDFVQSEHTKNYYNSLNGGN